MIQDCYIEEIKDIVKEKKLHMSEQELYFAEREMQKNIIEYFLNLVRLCAYTKKEIKKVILSTKSYTEKDLVDLPTIIDQWKNEYRSDRSLAWPTL